MRLLAAIVFIIVFIGCSSGLPKEILPPNQMELVVYDLIRIDEFINNFVIKDTTVDIRKKRSTLYEQVFKVHKITRDQFFSSYKYYQQNPKLQKELFDSLQEVINRKNVAGRADSASRTP